MIPVAMPGAQYGARRQEIDDAIARVLRGGRYILGAEVSAFEGEFAQYTGVRFGVGVGSGTEALHLALLAAGIGAGDEVVTVSHTAVATVAAIELAGARPVFADIDAEDFTLSPAAFEAAVTPRTKAVIPVHLYGQPAAMEAIAGIARARRIKIIEDCAQAHGARCGPRRVGAWGDMGCFSFYPTKNLGALGDGGMVVTDDPALAERLRLLREYGWSARYISSVPGLNSRLDELQAAVLRVKLKGLDGDNTARRRVAALYDAGLKKTPLVLPRTRSGTEHVHHLYVVRSPRRSDFQAFLKSRGVETLVHYPIPIHKQPAYAGRLAVGAGLPVTERRAAEVLSLPIYPEIADADVHAVIEAVVQFEK